MYSDSLHKALGFDKPASCLERLTGYLTANLPPSCSGAGLGQGPEALR